MHAFRLFSLGLLGLLPAPPATAQEPRLWRDPEQGCTYILTSDGGVGLRYRADGTPDCPGSGSTARSPSRAPGGDMRHRSGSARHGALPAAAAPHRGGSRSIGADARFTPPPDPVVTGSVERSPPADTPRRAALAFACRRSTEGETRDGLPSTARVRVEPQARLMLVDSGGAVQRYTLDTDWDVWFNGRSERDPRLGLLLSPSRGSMWLDVAARAGQRQEVRSLPFLCDPEDTAG